MKADFHRRVASESAQINFQRLVQAVVRQTDAMNELKGQATIQADFDFVAIPLRGKQLPLSPVQRDFGQSRKVQCGGQQAVVVGTEKIRMEGMPRSAPLPAIADTVILLAPKLRRHLRTVKVFGQQRGLGASGSWGAGEADDEDGQVMKPGGGHWAAEGKGNSPGGP